MPNNSKLPTTLTQLKPILAIVSTTIIVLIVALFITNIRPSPKPLESTPTMSRPPVKAPEIDPLFSLDQKPTLTDNTDVKYSGPPITTPSTLSLYHTTTTKPSDLSKHLIDTLSLSKVSDQSLAWKNPSSTITLYTNYSTNTIQLVFANQPSDRVGMDEDTSILTTQNLLKNFGIEFKPEFTNTQVGYLSSGNEPGPTTPDKATVAVVSLSSKINDYSLQTQSNLFSTTTIRLNNNYQPMKVYFTGNNINPTKIDERRGLTLEELINHIKTGDYILLDSYNDALIDHTNQPFFELDFTSVTLEYRLIDDQYLYPYYHFKGTGIFISEEFPQELEILVKATN